MEMNYVLRECLMEIWAAIAGVLLWACELLMIAFACLLMIVAGLMWLVCLSVMFFWNAGKRL